MTAAPPPQLRRVLGTADGVTLGLASMLGAGIFVVFAPAARAAGNGLLIAVAVAGLIAACNAASSMQLAVADPRAGGAYAWGRTHLGAWPGYVAGFGFVVGKTASCAAISLTVAGYLVPSSIRIPVAVAVLAVVTTVNCFGVQRTATAARVLLVPVLVVLVVALVVATARVAQRGAAPLVGLGSAAGTLQAAGLIFFAFAGYARVATLAEEVRNPRRTLPRAVLSAVAIVVALYAAAAALLLLVLGSPRLAAASAPWLVLADVIGPWLRVPLQVAAVLAATGSLLALLAGVSRTTVAMARQHDLPSPLARISGRSGTPLTAEVVVAIAAALLIVVGDVRLVIGFSSFGVLIYYGVANLAALRQAPPARIVPRAVSVLGVAGCVLLLVALPWQSVVTGALLLLAGVTGRLGALALRGARLRSHE